MATAVSQGVLNEARVERLHEIGSRALREALQREFGVVQPRQHDHCQLWVSRKGPGQELYPVHPWQLDIEKNDVEPPR